MEKGKKIKTLHFYDQNGTNFSIGNNSNEKYLLFIYQLNLDRDAIKLLSDLKDNYKTLIKNNIKVIIVNKDNFENNIKFSKDNDFNFIFVSNVDEDLLNYFNVLSIREVYYKRKIEHITKKLILVNEEGIIENIWEHLDDFNLLK